MDIVTWKIWETESQKNGIHMLNCARINKKSPNYKKSIDTSNGRIEMKCKRSFLVVIMVLNKDI